MDHGFCRCPPTYLPPVCPSHIYHPVRSPTLRHRSLPRPAAHPTCIFLPQYHPMLLLKKREESGGKKVSPPLDSLHQNWCMVKKQSCQNSCHTPSTGGSIDLQLLHHTTVSCGHPPNLRE